MVYKLQQNPATEGLPRSAGAWNRCADFPAYLPPGSVGHRYTRIQIWGRVPASSFGSGLKGKPLRAVQCVQGAFMERVQLTRRWVQFRPTAIKASPAENRVRLSPPGRRRSVCHGGENDAAGCSLWIGLRGL